MGDSDSCVLVLGSTGTGKSTLISFCTGEAVNVSGGTNECTLDIKAYTDRALEGSPFWIDSVGFDGTDTERSDEEAFQYVLKFLQDNNISNLIGILWTVNPDNRESARLQEQARLINKFKERTIWQNVIIVVKKSTGEPDRDAAGAIAAASRNDGESMKVLGYSLVEELDDNAKEFWLRQSKEDRNKMGIMTREEARSLIFETMETLPPKLKVVFKNSKCYDCGVVSDRRLFPLSCHTSKETVHPQSNVPFHRGTQTNQHPSANVATRHTGSVQYRKERTGGNRVTGRRYKEVPYMSCCGNDPAHGGCQVYHPCCNQPQGTVGCKTVFTCCGSEVSAGNPGCARRFPCCQREENSPGCRDQCVYCKEIWGQFDITKGCIGREHKNIGDF